MDTRTPEQRRRIMQAVRSKDTKPEIIVRRFLHAMGYRYRLHRKDLPGRPDIAFIGRRKAIFVHGCYWHQHGCPKGRLPKSRLDYWEPKLEKNVKRDKTKIEQLESLGWKSLVLWQCELTDVGALAIRLQEFLGQPYKRISIRDVPCTIRQRQEQSRKRKMRPIGIDLFAGAGGLSLGFEQAGFDIAAAIEIDPVHCAVHQFNFPNTAMLARSVEGLSGDEIRDAALIGGRPVDCVFGGAPCQGFSLIGHRVFDDPRNGLVRHFVRIVAELKARTFVFENVKGLTLGQHKVFLEELVVAFDEAGYTVRTAVEGAQTPGTSARRNRARG